MKKVLTVVCLILTVFTATLASSENQNCNITPDDINKHFVVPVYVIDEVTDLKDQQLCQIFLYIYGQPAVLYMPYSKAYLIGGELFVNKQMFTQTKIMHMEAKHFNEYKDQVESLVAFTYKPARDSGKYIYFFTDPECPYCEQAKTKIKQLADEKGITVKVVLFPLPIHPGAKDKAIRLICSKATYEDYLKNDYKGTTCPQGEEKVNKSLEIAEKLKINGTPTFISQDGKRIPGLNLSALEQL
jgi:thiol:disulfide interchange protein DsbC